ncbi:MAG: 4Fe-4S dicluster domain-containing protein, partial [Gammaproteobacteria bacterium]|nr:4Fe-4S dicluster domain-containing protein [Gammaproteobacteria bacterium]
MRTRLGQKIQQSRHADDIQGILRNCVHCGFCNATCPTYQLLGDELDGPRGRIYQMKQYFEGAPANAEILGHLDRCLTCRACETTCPSGVKYSHLLEIGKELIEEELPRPWLDRMRRHV